MNAFCCKGDKCGHVLGTHDGHRFYAGGAVISHALQLSCPVCKKQTTWTPAPRTIADAIRERKTVKA